MESGRYKLLRRAVVSHQQLQNGLWRPTQLVKRKYVEREQSVRGRKGLEGSLRAAEGLCSMGLPPAALLHFPVPFPGLCQPGLFSGSSILPGSIPMLCRRHLPSRQAAWKGANVTASTPSFCSFLAERVAASLGLSSAMGSWDGRPKGIVCSLLPFLPRRLGVKPRTRLLCSRLPLRPPRWLSRFLWFCGSAQPPLSRGRNTAGIWGTFARHRRRAGLNSNQGTDFFVKMGKFCRAGATHFLGLMLPSIIGLAPAWSVPASLIL